LGESVGLYVRHMRRRCLSEATIERRLRCLALLHEHCGGVLDVDYQTIESFLDDRELGATTRVNWVSHLHCFYAWAVAHEHTDRDPTARLTRPKMRRRLPRPIREDDYRHALTQSPTALMTAWLLLGGHGGLRCMEMAGLRGEDVDLGARTLRVIGKGDKEREVPMHTRVVNAVEPFPRRGCMFVNPATGGPYTPAQVSAHIGRYLTSVGVHARAHQLRHRFASVLLEETGDIEVVAEILGHDSLDTTRIYAGASTRRKRGAVDRLR
jgi:integrase/recombinase XerD